MKDIEKLLEKYRNSKAAKSPIKTPDCPTDEELYLLSHEDAKDGPLRQKYLNHLIFCNFCATATKVIIKEKIDTQHSITKIKKRLYPLPEEIDWNNIESVELFKDNVLVSKPKQMDESSRVAIDVTEPGFYHIAINSGQIIWRREIPLAEIRLSDEELKKARGFGMAASTDKYMEGIVGFEESEYEDKLHVTLYKRLNKVILVLAFRRK